MVKKTYFMTIYLCALSILSACSDEDKKHSTPQTTQQQPEKNLDNVATKTENITQSLKQHKNEFDKSIKDISSTLTELSDTYESDLKVNEKQINELAGKLGKLAKQAGESARMLEKTTKTLGDAIQEGFNEGYNEKK
ncbi:MAG: hypothetical protein KGV50_04795 [Gammaproteobacteria bacterium]|nr:hypothetical protein [Gammaproteobacteria bacterium]